MTDPSAGSAPRPAAAEPLGAAAAPSRGSGKGWRSPEGIGAIASVLGVIVAAIAILVGNSGGAPAGATTTPAPTPESARLFVYGTTMPGHLRYVEIEEFVATTRRDRVSGRLYDTGYGYPAAKFGGGQGWIEGYVLELRPGRAEEADRVLTRLEGGLYDAVQVTTESGLTATAYEWIESTDGMDLVEGIWDRPEQ